MKMDILKQLTQARENGITKRVVIYGTGAATESLLTNIDQSMICGVMDAQKEGTYFMGLPVYTVEEAKSCADVVVIAARPAVIPIIYDRIKELEKSGIVIVDITGKMASEYGNHRSKEYIDYLEKSFSQLKELIDSHELISFDIFDTLLMRKILRPIDLYGVIEKEICYKLGEKIEYVTTRMLAEKKAEREKLCITYDDIYREFQQLSGLRQEVVRKIQDIELDVEKRFICRRERMMEALQYAMQQNKCVLLISDMYLSKAELEGILEDNGIVGYDALFVSCEENANKWHKGDLFQKVLQRYGVLPRKMLHIGDNPSSDIACAKLFGIDTYHIWSAYEMCVQSDLRQILVNAWTTEDYVLIGLILANVFNNPFAFVEEETPDISTVKSEIGKIFKSSSGEQNEYDRMIIYPHDCSNVKHYVELL